jgi:hypothetical protein
MIDWENLKLIDDQGLRNLRHCLAYKEDSHFAYCTHCGKEFTYKTPVGLHCQNVSGIECERNSDKDLEIDQAIPKACITDSAANFSARMHALCIEFQKSTDEIMNKKTRLAVNAAYNCHASSHVTGCLNVKRGERSSSMHTDHLKIVNGSFECLIGQDGKPQSGISKKTIYILSGMEKKSASQLY